MDKEKTKEEELIDCHECKGEGILIAQIGTTAVCCMNADEYGNCCNNPTPEPIFDYEQCQVCEATGKTEQ